MRLRDGDRFELLTRAPLMAANRQRCMWLYPAGTTGRILNPASKFHSGCALIELLPAPSNGAPRKYFVKYQYLLLTEQRPEAAY